MSAADCSNMLRETITRDWLGAARVIGDWLAVPGSYINFSKVGCGAVSPYAVCYW